MSKTIKNFNDCYLDEIVVVGSKGGVVPKRCFFSRSKPRQSWSLAAQFEAGVRYFEVPVTVSGGGLYVNKVPLGGIVEMLNSFLKDQPSEFILLSLKFMSKVNPDEIYDLIKPLQLKVGLRCKVSELVGRITVVQASPYFYTKAVHFSTELSGASSFRYNATVKKYSFYSRYNSVLDTDKAIKEFDVANAPYGIYIFDHVDKWVEAGIIAELRKKNEKYRIEG